MKLPDQMMDTMGQMESICLLTYQDSTPLEFRPKAEKDFRLLSVDLAWNELFGEVDGEMLRKLIIKKNFNTGC